MSQTSGNQGMNEQLGIIIDTGNRIFADGVDKAVLDTAERGEFAQSLWDAVVATGFHVVGSADSGTGLTELFALLDVAGTHAAPLPLVETLLANAWFGAADDVSSIGILDGNWIVDVPWGRRARRVIGIRPDSGECVIVEQVDVVDQRVNLAGEPRDVVKVPGTARKSSTSNSSESAWSLLALGRAVQTGGVLSTVLDIALQYAGERAQFGRTLSKFQAIQHSLAVQAAEVAAARRAATGAVDAAGTTRFEAEVAAAKIRAGDAATVVGEAAHQALGAIGYTHEHRLHHFTRRAWAWRDEYGNEFDWQRKLGAMIAGDGADNVWSFITGR
ncbi:MAG: hypothetical protein FJ194_09850 [Gammaproteobacteria bacterium]|nr:hypothetical protein [Gammaproteobacteria bacterium]